MTKELYISEVKSLLIEFYNQLEFQKKVFVSITESLHQTEKFSYIKKIQKEQITDLFGNNEVIVESYKEIFPKRILSESKFDTRDEINKFNDFLFLSMCQKIGVLREDSNFNPLKWVKKKYRIIQEQRISDLPQNQQTNVNTGFKPNLTPQKNVNLYDQIPNSPVKQQFVKDQQALAKKMDDLKNAVNYIKQNGISTIMEGLRSALFSIGGIVVQTALAFTGAGAIANDVAWGILTLYDGYQYFVNGTGLMNLVIDIICLVTAGTLGPVLGKYIGKAASSISGVIKILMEGGAGKVIKPSLNTIKNGASVLSKWLGEAAAFMKNKMSINWVSDIVSRVQKLFTTIYDELAKWVGESVGNIAATGIRAGAWIGEKASIPILEELALLDANKYSQYVAQHVSKKEVEEMVHYIKTNMSDNRNEEILRFIDSKYGTHMGDFYANYVMAKHAQHGKKEIGKSATGAATLSTIPGHLQGGH
jgi:hypothetical protein